MNVPYSIVFMLLSTISKYMIHSRDCPEAAVTTKRYSRFFEISIATPDAGEMEAPSEAVISGTTAVRSTELSMVT
ncbi:hypothetical protein SDC9_202479 [bioreactor metagenome]|uniref:Uncharacterized protein n=1 Tax=bioreactor metagenome TaxID=1076179 RepID=A0A645IVB3_9ZZZZ